ncbi:MAG: thioredoxin domain-containing protein [Moorea sp. SIO2B7]|nr:thioredoxin domain-containing protein [Moorena sp. SIO2B7]
MHPFRFFTHALSHVSRLTKIVLGLLLLCIILLSSSRPVQAANQISPQLEEQMLQVIREHPEVIVESFKAYQQRIQEQSQEAQQAFVQKLETNPQAVIGDSPKTGASQSKVIMVEFSDFQCPYCARAHKTVQEFMAKHEDEVTLVYKHFPLASIHPQAVSAAKATWAAFQQGKFWEYHDELFTKQEQLGESFYLETAQRLNLDVDQFNRDRNSQAAETAISQDLQLAESLGVKGTPFFVMNGELFAGARELKDMEKRFTRVKQLLSNQT